MKACIYFHWSLSYNFIKLLWKHCENLGKIIYQRTRVYSKVLFVPSINPCCHLYNVIFPARYNSYEKSNDRLFVCWGLTSFLNIWGHITTVPACSSGTLTNVLPLRIVIPHNTPPRHSIQTQGRPVVVLQIDVERHTWIHNYPLRCLGSYPIEKSFSDLPHTAANAQLYDAVMVVVSQKLGRKSRTTLTTESWTRDL